MTYLKDWTDFQKAAEYLYLKNPARARYTMKYVHSKNLLILKMTDDSLCIQYKTENHYDLRKVERFIGNLMRHITNLDSYEEARDVPQNPEEVDSD